MPICKFTRSNAAKSEGNSSEKRKTLPKDECPPHLADGLIFFGLLFWQGQEVRRNFGKFLA